MRAKTRNSTLDQAMALLVQNNAAFLLQLAETNKRQADTDQRLARLEIENRECFERIEEEIRQIKLILLRHEQMLAALPETIRQKIGFEDRQ
jgi:hypothetical protein